MEQNYTSLKGLTDIGQSSITEVIEDNIIHFFDWGFLDKGSFFNISIPNSGQWGGNKNRLRLVDDPNYTYGQVWETFRSNWVWESGLSVSTQPIQLSGVYVNNTFFPANTTGNYGHHYNYPLGRVVFNSGLATNSNVQLNYSYKLISVIDADSVPFFKQLQYGSFRVDSDDFLVSKSGNWSILGNTRIQMPAIAVEYVDGNSTPYALGGGQYVNRRFLFHVLSENDDMGHKIADVIANQKDKTIFMYDVDAVARNRNFPLTAAGTIASGALTYPQLIETYKYSKVLFSNTEMTGGGWLTKDVHHNTVMVETRVIVGNI
jgi:hypothetical protein